MDTGWIKIHRSIWEQPWATDHDAMYLWIYLISHSMFRKKEIYWNGKLIELQPGQLVTGRKVLSKNTEISESKIRRLLKLFEELQQIDQQTTNTSTLISILNYEKYQDISQGSTNEQPTNNQQMTTKEERKERKNINNNNNSLQIISNHPLSVWVRENCSNLQKFREQLTDEQSEKLINDFGLDLVKVILNNLDNYKDSHKKYNSVYRTALNWAKNEKQKNGNRTNNQGSSPKVSFDDAIRNWVSNG